MPKAKRGARQADRADRHRLYEAAVQDTEAEVEFLCDTYEQLRGRKPLLVREDFCGTAVAACEWVKQGPKNRAIGVDLDGEVLAWGREHHIAKLSADQQKRIAILQEDVLTTRPEPADVVLALNFSYWIFKTRERLRAYYANVRQGLAEGGIMIMDCYGGYDAYKEMREKRDVGRFTYIWDQESYDPVSGDYVCHIHFRFPDGSQLHKAFSYHWRLWSLPELRELLIEAGFSRVTVYWQGTDEETGDGNGEFTPVERGEADPAWIAYLVAEK